MVGPHVWAAGPGESVALGPGSSWGERLTGACVQPTSILRPGIAVLSFTPWELGVNDLKEFSARAQVSYSNLTSPTFDVLTYDTLVRTE